MREETLARPKVSHGSCTCGGVREDKGRMQDVREGGEERRMRKEERKDRREGGREVA